MGRTSTLALAMGLVVSLGMATPAAAQQGHHGGDGHGKGHGHGPPAATVHRDEWAARRAAAVPVRRVADVRYETRAGSRTGLSDIMRGRMGVSTRTYDRSRVYVHRDHDRDRRDHRHDRDWYRYRYHRHDRRVSYDRYAGPWRGAGGPKFCRTGAGHPVYGRAWCIQKGFGLGGNRWDRVYWGDAWLRHARASGAVARVGLSDILGSAMYGRLDARRRHFGYAAPLSGRWFRTESGAPALLIRAGTQPLAELIDTNRDGRADLVLLRRA